MYIRQIIVSGKVQGVGFRNYAQKQAIEFKIIGWARNLTTGEVEIVAVSREMRALEQFIDTIRRGSARARVDNLEINVIDSLQIPNDTFTVLPDGDKKSEF